MQINIYFDHNSICERFILSLLFLFLCFMHFLPAFSVKLLSDYQLIMFCSLLQTLELQ